MALDVPFNAIMPGMPDVDLLGMLIATLGVSNTGLKLAVALVFGSPPFKQIAGGTLAVMILAAAAALALPLP